MLARLYSLNYSLELFDIETPLEKAVAFAERGVKLDPANQRVRSIMAFVLLFKNELSAGLAEIDQALQLNPNSLIFLENIAHLATLLGTGKRVPHSLRKRLQKSVLQQNCSLFSLGRLGPAGKIRPRIRGNPALQDAYVILGSIDEGRKLGSAGKNGRGGAGG
jgi:tetratricopeptide (TPR) repeat protein